METCYPTQDIVSRIKGPGHLLSTDCGSPEHFDSMNEWGRSCQERIFNVKLRVAKLRQNSSSDDESVDSIEF
jgi:hypothetical protein